MTWKLEFISEAMQIMLRLSMINREQEQKILLQIAMLVWSLKMDLLDKFHKLNTS